MSDPVDIRPGPDLSDILASYVPALIKRRLASEPAAATAAVAVAGPTAERFAAAVLYANVSGFAELAERLAGADAAPEALSRLLNRYFGQLIDLIIAHGGDVVTVSTAFASEGLLALWPVVESGTPETGTGDRALAAMTLRAARCGLAAAAKMRTLEIGATTLEPLALRVIIDAGDISAVYVGGERQRWEFLIVGLPLIQIGEAEALTQPGEVMLGPQAWQLIQARCTGLRLPTGAVRLRAIQAPLPPRPLESPVLPPGAEEILWSYIPGAIRARLGAGQSGWLAELRTVTVLLINLPDLNLTAPLALAQGIMLDVQRALYRYEGSVSKISVDDQGVTFVTALGLSPLAHKDDAARGVKAALEIQARLRSWGLRTALGIATGPAFCGVIGNAKRREYTLIGEPVNVAQRLMLVAAESGPPPILTDDATYQAAKSAVAFSPPTSVLFEGQVTSTFVYRPLEPREARPHTKIALVGRGEARRTLDQRLRALLNRQGGVILIEGETGIGKSRLVEMLVHQAEALGVTTLLGRGDAADTVNTADPARPADKTRVYHAWRPIFRQLFHLDPPPAATLLGDEAEVARPWAGAPIMGTRQAYIMAYLKRVHPRLVRLAPLLKAVLPLEISESYVTAQMDGEARADHTRDLLLQLLQEAATINPLVVILEDAQWLDAASWALAQMVGRRIPTLLLVVVTALLPDPQPEGYAYLRQRTETWYLRVPSLGVAETRALIRERLGMSHVPDTVVDFVYERTEGHPLFIEELVYAMRDAGLLHFADGTCYLTTAPTNQRESTLAFLDTIQGAITGRIDRLSPPQQLTLKVASIIGQTFSLRLLRDIYPIARDKPHLRAYLQALTSLDFIDAVGPEAGGASAVDALPQNVALTVYSFKHAIIQEVAYNLMAFAQRRRLHRAVATWYERTYAGELAPFYPLLAHHWEHAGDLSQAATYLAQAGEQAFESGAYQEATRYFKSALAMDPEGEERRRDVPRARWERLLAEACWYLGKTQASEQHLRQALRRLGQPEPETRRGMWLALLRLTLSYMLAKVGLLGQHPDQSVLFEIGAVYRRLAERYYFNHQFIRAAHAGLRAWQALTRANLEDHGAIAPATLALAKANLWIGRAALPFWRGGASRLHEPLTLPPALRGSLQLRISIYEISQGHWDAAQQALSAALEAAEQVGNWRLLGDSLTLLLLAAYYQGAFTRVAGLTEELNAWTSRYDGVQPEASFPQRLYRLSVQGLTHLCAGQLAEALHALQTAQKTLEQTQQPSDDQQHSGALLEIFNRGLLAVVYLRRGAYAQATATAAALMALLAGRWPLSAFTLDGYTAVAQVYLTLWETDEIHRQAQDDGAAVGRSDVARACRDLRRYARLFPIGEPRAWLYRGTWGWLNHKPYRARRLWHKSLAAAERLAMPYEKGLAYYELGRHLPIGDITRREYLGHAYSLFKQTGAAYDCQRVEEELQRG